MRVQLVAEQEITVGGGDVIMGPVPDGGPFEAVFEDDGETGYFYALNHTAGEQPIVDAVHIYNVEDVADHDLPSLIRICWSQDNCKVVLLINDYPHAVFDFSAQRGYCRTGFPPPAEDSGWSGHAWDDAAVELFAVS